MVMTKHGLELSGDALKHFLAMKREVLNFECCSECYGCPFKIDGEYCMFENLDEEFDKLFAEVIL